MTDAKQLTENLGGKWYARYGSAPCPVCQPEGRRHQNALTVSERADGRLLMHCKKGGCDFHDILAAAGVVSGEWTRLDPFMVARREAELQAEASKRADLAHTTWLGASPLDGTPAETYLRSRGISCRLPDTLRFCLHCWHPSGHRLPALVARVDGSVRFAVHRTYLRADGGDKAQVDPNKAMLGSVGGGAVVLAEADGQLVVSEGIETGLSLASGLLRVPSTIWAALSTSGMRSLRLPPAPGRLVVASDGDAPGREAAHALAERASGLGWKVSLLPAPDGRDWNDVLVGKGVTA